MAGECNVRQFLKSRAREHLKHVARHAPASLLAALIFLARDLRFAALLTVLTAAWSTTHTLTPVWPPPFMEIASTVWRFWYLQLPVNFAIVSVISFAHRALPAPGAARWAGLLVLCALATGVGMGAHLLAGEFAFLPSHWLKSGYFGFIFGMICTQVLLLAGLCEFVHLNHIAADALHASALRQLALQVEATQARLQLLQAQVEPHFLFNTFANVRRLLRTDAAAASGLLLDLLRYLGEALPRLRDSKTTLGHEVKLTHAFLSVHAVRMGQRLCFDFDVPAELAGRSVPPMSLLTLVENALKHGLQPLPEGGSIHISARALDGALRLTVADDGLGMGDASGHGTGLANLRGQLKAIYGGAASLSLRVNEPRGVTATVALPDLQQ
jgi:signal transduction histidine kinase